MTYTNFMVSGASTATVIVVLVVSSILIELMAGTAEAYGIRGIVTDWFTNLNSYLLLWSVREADPGTTLIGHVISY